MAETSHAEAEAKVLSQASNSNERPIYEVGFHLVSTLDDETVTKTVEKIHKALGDAEIINEQAPQRMTLAYTVERSDSGKHEKFTESYFGFIKFALERSEIPQFENALRAMKDVLRFLLIQTVREEISAVPRRAIFASDRLEGETIKKPTALPEEKVGEVSEDELNKSIDALVA